jgi:uncharacterized protein Yka (UPF0111/DUF47 family)
MAFTVGFPVNFTPAGDKTKEALYKHIQEISKIYEHLNDISDASGEGLANAAELLEALRDEINERLEEITGEIGDAEDGAISSVKVGDVVL